jgi:hypothetical protein
MDLEWILILSLVIYGIQKTDLVMETKLISFSPALIAVGRKCKVFGKRTQNGVEIKDNYLSTIPTWSVLVARGNIALPSIYGIKVLV